MATAMRGLVLAALVAGGCVFGSRPILPNDPDPTMVIDAGLAGGGGGADAASRSDVGIPATGSDSAVPPPQDAASAMDAAAPFADAASEDDAAAPMDTAPALDAPRADVGLADARMVQPTRGTRAMPTPRSMPRPGRTARPERRRGPDGSGADGAAEAAVVGPDV
jgi:hypothetical protein